MLTVGYTITKIRARILLLTGGGWLAWGIYNEGDPLSVAWRAALAAVAMSWACGHLLRIGAEVITKRMQEIEAAQAAEEAATAGGCMTNSGSLAAYKAAEQTQDANERDAQACSTCWSTRWWIRLPPTPQYRRSR